MCTGSPRKGVRATRLYFNKSIGITKTAISAADMQTAAVGILVEAGMAADVTVGEMVVDGRKFWFIYLPVTLTTSISVDVGRCLRAFHFSQATVPTFLCHR